MSLIDRIYRRTLERHLSDAMRAKVERLRMRYRIWRIGRFATALLGSEFHRSRRRIELNITFACNLKCLNCDRSCEQAPTSMHMSLQQITHFIEESVAAAYRWDEIIVIGGEPTIHKDFLEIINALRDYRDRHSPHTRIEVFTNGCGQKVNDALARLPSDIFVENSAKDARTQVIEYHDSFNVAPSDLPLYRNADFRNGCWITDYCGIALGPSGYYPCGVATGMDRIFGWDIGRPSLPAEQDKMEDLLSAFCRNCGHFKRDAQQEHPDSAQASPAWQNAYASYQQAKPILKVYGVTERSAHSDEPSPTALRVLQARDAVTEPIAKHSTEG